MALGDFTPSNMSKLILSLDDAMSDSRVQQRHKLMPKLDIIEQVKDVETANWNSVRPKDQYCMDFDVAWLEESDTEATLNTAQTMLHRPKCTITGEELQSNKKTYKLEKSINLGFAVKDEDCGNIFDWEGKIALGMLQTQKKILERWAKGLPALLDAGAGPNLLNGSGFDDFDWNIGSLDGTGTEIAPTDLNFQNSSYYLNMLFEINKFQNPRIIDGGVFSYDAWLAGIQKGAAAADIGSANAWEYIADRYKADFINMYRAGYANNAFVIDQGSWAMPTVSYFPRLGQDNEVKADKYIYSVPFSGFTLNGNPVYFDMTYTKAEEQIASTGRCQLVHVFDLELKWDLWQAPKYTTDTVTGTIKIERGDGV